MNKFLVYLKFAVILEVGLMIYSFIALFLVNQYSNSQTFPSELYKKHYSGMYLIGLWLISMPFVYWITYKATKLYIKSNSVLGKSYKGIGFGLGVFLCTWIINGLTGNILRTTNLDITGLSMYPGIAAIVSLFVASKNNDSRMSNILAIGFLLFVLLAFFVMASISG